MSDRRERAAAADREARRAAVEVWDRPLLVEAGAGSGKTAVLVARLVAWTVGPGWERAAADQGPGAEADVIARRCFDGAVAMTFTEAAAAEMAERTRAALELLAAGELPVGVGNVPAAARERARFLVSQCRALQATTIHAFAGRLLREHAFEAGLHPGWRIDADGSMWRQLVDEAIEQELPSLWLDGAVPVRILAAAGLGPSELAQVVRALAEEGVAASWVAQQASASIEQVVKVAAAAVDALLATARGPLARAGRLRGRLELAGAVLFRLTDLSARLVQTPAEAAAIAGRFEANLRRRLADWADRRFTQTESTVFAAVAEQLADQASRVHRVMRHLGRCRIEQFAAAAGAAAAVLGRAEREAVRRGIVRFADLVPLAGRLLRQDVGVGASTRSRLRQVLIDEVQDTDHEQLELISQLAFGGGLERPGLFLVGDPKQSIYGWRSADLAAYDELGARVEREGGTVLRLVANFRSVPPILEAVERWVEPVMIREPGIQPQFEPLLPRRQLPPDAAGPVVERWRSDPGSRSLAATELEAAAIATELAQLIAAGMAPESAAILLRTTGDLPIYLEALRRRRVPYAVARERGWRRRREVVEAGAVLRVLLDPADHLALVAVLRSALVGAPDGAIEPLWQLGLPRAFGALEHGAEGVCGVLAQVPREWQETGAGWCAALVRFAEQVGVLRRSLAELPSDRWVRQVREELGIEALELGRPLGSWRCEAVRRLFEVVRQALDLGQTPLEVAAFLRRAPAGFEEDGDVSAEPNLVPGAVRVMTVHAAKGLDFDLVYVAQLHKEPAVRRRPRATAVLNDDSGGRHLVLAGWPAPDAWQGEEAAGRVAAAEQVRLFYVALTRARERLVLVGRAAGQSRPHPLSFADLIADDPVEQGRGDATVRVVELEPQTDEPPEGVPNPPNPAPQARRWASGQRTSLPFVAIPSDEGHERTGSRVGDDPEQARAVGRIVHRALELVDLELPDDALAPRLLDLVASLARHEHEAIERSAADVVQAFIGGPLWARWIGARQRVRARELPFVSPGGDGLAAGAVIGVLDCVLHPEHPGQQWLVVDYKTDRLEAGESAQLHAERYRPQGEAYAAALGRGLGLQQPPRVEWWFLREGLVVELPSSS